MSLPSNYTTIQMLPEDQKFNGENYTFFKATILSTGHLKGLQLYWEGKINIPKGSPDPKEDKAMTSTSTPESTIPASAPKLVPSPTAINDPSPTLLEYELRESVAYLTLWNNIKNPNGLGIPHGLSSSELWSYLETEFLKVTAIARQEGRQLTCRYTEKMRILLKEANDCGSGITPTQFNTIFLDSFPRTPVWLVPMGNLMGETSFSVIESRLEEFFLHTGGGSKSAAVSISSGHCVSALQAEVEHLKALMSQGRSRGPANPNLVCSNPNCKGKGHLIQSCWKLGGGKQGQYPKWWKGQRDIPVINPFANQVTTNHSSDSSTVGNIYTLSATMFKAIAKPFTTLLGPCHRRSQSSNQRHRELLNVSAVIEPADTVKLL
ncbi:hypothetical protein F5878DRAFT_702798 [Lentinula raphanica]|uniref:Uncharacterized protein n=1 Tax=Lentinula raphanica TaxID=153919 RepID=A0AA38PFJ2_9AGAR|nr:hypothetical protein F5878DRAFT_702798 [Lentinula raphanica]